MGGVSPLLLLYCVELIMILWTDCFKLGLKGAKWHTSNDQ